jgi:hypothetical protein
MHKMINPSFTRGEYWLLETVAEFGIPICWLVYEDIEEALNKQGHGMERPLLVDTMQWLFSEGLIVAHKFGQPNDCFNLTTEQIDSALNEKRNMKEHYYCLTTKGSELWEAFASPRWDNYITECYEPINDTKEKCILMCSQKGRLESQLNSLRYYEYEIEDDSIMWDIEEPWQATYWKQLAIGHRVSFVFKYKDKDYSLPNPLNRCWYDKLWCRWR